MTAPADRSPSILAVADEGGRQIGTAVLISTDIVATAAHVLQGLTISTVTLVNVADNDHYRAKAEYSGDGKGPDLALLRILGQPPRMRPALLTQRVRPGEEVRVLGIGRDFPTGVWVQGRIAGRLAADMVQIHITAGSVDGGFSGAPVVSVDGEVLGIVIERTTNDSGQDIVMLPAETIRRLRPDRQPPAHRPADPAQRRRGDAVYSGYASDAAVGEDLLDRGAEVEALALLIAARSTAPPMSVGLFGDWGTGKTFFLEKLRERIREMTADPADEESVCRQVRQIVFNAWHYTDANLWASLVSAIFTELAEPRHGESTAEARERWAGQRRLLVRELETTREHLGEAQARYTAAEAEVGKVAGDLERVRAERSRDRQVLRTMQAVGELVLDDDGMRERLREAGRQLDLQAGTELQELRRAADDAATLTQRVGRLWSLVRARDRGRVTTWFWCAGAVAAALCVVVPLLVDRFANGVVQVFAGLVACAVPLAAAARQALRTVGRVAGIAESVADKAAQVEQKVRERQAREEAAMLADLRDLESKEAELRADLAAAQARKDAAARALEDAESGRQLASFVRERSESADYRGQLGIIATVRRDFDRLAELLTQADWERAPRPLERIVLYVDDLDRCAPDRVVEVLQAVHLLLGLPLFVVVVAVDPRWMLGSLDLHFERVLGRKQTAAAETRHWAATPVNYLEKIFQIPFNISAMLPADFGRLIGDLVTPAPDPSPEPASRAIVGPDALRTDRAPGSRAAATSAGQPVALHARAEFRTLTVSDAERELLAAMGPLIATPRAAKRLVNLYRLTRALLSEETLAAFVQQRDYQSVVVLLAVLVGMPQEAMGLFDGVLEADGAQPWAEFVARLEPGRLRDALTGVLPELTDTMTVDRMRGWIPLVARYSFHTGELAGSTTWAPPVEHRRNPATLIPH
ncbi:P-loop NTPase fold protein [Actinoplanes sp. NPDC051411]|uniref:P-loop NTPase fold protein n=1 Tax=Actinoplanes sp. NPDC051411 TaxID=3155522 RepID=UPI00343CB9A3